MAQLVWKDFQTNLSEFIYTTENNQDFADVTLVADDNSQIYASKIMLCSASIFFSRILGAHQNSHTTIYLKGVSKQDLGNIVTFIYNGEVKIGQNHLSNFMSVSEDLQINGLHSSKDKNIEPKTLKILNDSSSPETAKFEELAINPEPTRTHVPGDLFLDNIKVEAHEEYENKHIIECDPLVRKEILHNKEKSFKHKYNKNSKRPKSLKEYIGKEVQPYREDSVCMKSIGNDKKKLATHWHANHLENKINDSVSDMVYSHNGSAKEKRCQNIQNNILVGSSSDRGIPNNKTLKHHVTKPRNETNNIPKFWDEYNVKNRKEGEKYKCNICGSYIPAKIKTLENHWRKYHSEAPEDQVVIVKEGENPNDVIASLIELKSSILGQGIITTCTICGLSQHRSDLVRHIDAHHIRGAKYKCDYCSKIFTCLSSHGKHLRECIEKAAEEDPERVLKQMSTVEVKYPCVLCESKVSFENNRHLKSHIRRHHK